jgi:hypothetical protein
VVRPSIVALMLAEPTTVFKVNKLDIMCFLC